MARTLRSPNLWLLVALLLLMLASPFLERSDANRVGVMLLFSLVMVSAV